MVRLLVLSSGGSVLDWLVVRFRGDNEGVSGQRGTCSEMPSRESCSLPLELKRKQPMERSENSRFFSTDSANWSNNDSVFFFLLETLNYESFKVHTAPVS